MVLYLNLPNHILHGLGMQILGIGFLLFKQLMLMGITLLHKPYGMRQTNLGMQ
jgi:hypothetical protein